MPTKVILPQMGEAVIEATITNWLKKEGDAIEEYEALVEVNTDKVDSEIPSPVSGTVLKIVHSEGETIPVDTVLAWIGEKGEKIPKGGSKTTKAKPAAKAAPEPKPKPVADQPPKQRAAPVSTSMVSTPTPQSNGGAGGAVVSPLVARVAQEHNVDLSQVRGTGSGGRITKQDVTAFVIGGFPAAVPAQKGARSTFLSPVVARLVAENNINIIYVSGTGKEGRITKKDIEAYIAAGKPVTVVPVVSPVSSAPTQRKPRPPGPAVSLGSVMKLDPVRKAIATHMVQSKHTSPHVTTVMEADMSNVIAHRTGNKTAFAAEGVKLTFTAYVISAIVSALKAYPIVNSSWTDEGVAVHHDINVGMAVALDGGGLIVPVIKLANNLALLGMARAINDLAERARSKKLVPNEVQGGTFTLTNHGTGGSLFATPIINQPQCGILSTGLMQKRAVVINDAIAIRPMVYIGLTFDHRILDGAIADYFLGTVKESIEDWR